MAARADKLTYEELQEVFADVVCRNPASRPAAAAGAADDDATGDAVGDVATRRGYHEVALQHALGRLEAGRHLANFVDHYFPRRRLDILDLGAGNGGVSFGLGSRAEHRFTALDVVANPVLRLVRRRAGMALAQVVGRGEALPLAERSFDLVLCLDSFEHFTRPGAIAAEIMRVLRPGGACLLTTPARFKYLLRPDPHCGLRGLLLLPDGAQRFLVNRVLRWPTAYDVHHTYWNLGELLTHFPGHGRVEVLWDRPPGGGNWLTDRLWLKYRLFLWDGLLIFRQSEGEPRAVASWEAMPSPLAEISDWEEKLGLDDAAGGVEPAGPGAQAR